MDRNDIKILATKIRTDCDQLLREIEAGEQLTASNADRTGDSLRHLADAIATRLLESLPKPTSVPIDVALWDTAVIAEYLRRTQNYVRNKIIAQPGFPKQIRLPSGEGKRSNPLWRAKDVIAWAASFIET